MTQGWTQSGIYSSAPGIAMLQDAQTELDPLLRAACRGLPFKLRPYRPTQR